MKAGFLVLLFFTKWKIHGIWRSLRWYVFWNIWRLVVRWQEKRKMLQWMQLCFCMHRLVYRARAQRSGARNRNRFYPFMPWSNTKLCLSITNAGYSWPEHEHDVKVRSSCSTSPRSGVTAFYRSESRFLEWNRMPRECPILMHIPWQSLGLFQRNVCDLSWIACRYLQRCFAVWIVRLATIDLSHGDSGPIALLPS